MSLAELVDELIEGEALVFGSLPPRGRDLDLLVRPPDAPRIARRLAGLGLARKRDRWARFEGCTVDSLELVTTEAWGLESEEVDDLFREASPLDRLPHLVRPAPHHALLIQARKLIGAGGRLAPKDRDRIAEALREDPGAWDGAEARAPRWGARRALAHLRSAYERGTTVSLTDRAAALREQLLAGGEPGPLARVRAWRRALGRRRRGAVIALSGLDGSGKTTQAEALQRALDRLGYDAVVEWTRFAHNPSLDAVAIPAKRALARLGGGAQRSGAARAPTAPLGRAIRERSRVLNQAWITFVTLANVAAQRRATRPHLRRGRIVVSDRYTLDSCAHIRYKYGPRAAFRLQRALLRALVPRPVRAFWLDVPPEVAMARKAEDYTLEQRALEAGLYREEHGPLGARRLDGERPREELCAEIAPEVWRSLP